MQPVRKDILAQAFSARNAEVFSYQVNIDNYERAIRRIASLNDSDLDDFRAKLVDLLASERLEQKKAMVMRDVIAEQLQEIEDVRSEAA